MATAKPIPPIPPLPKLNRPGTKTVMEGAAQAIAAENRAKQQAAEIDPQLAARLTAQNETHGHVHLDPSVSVEHTGGTGSGGMVSTGAEPAVPSKAATMDDVPDTGAVEKALAADLPLSASAPASVTAPPPSATPTIEDIEEALRDVIDPELGVNIVDLGLVYGIEIDDRDVVRLDMTLTSAGCPLTDLIEEQASASVEGLAAGLEINWVWLPPWGPDKITDDGRVQLKAMGFNL